MRTPFLLLFVLFLLPPVANAQSKYQKQTTTGLNYWANDDVEIIGFVEEYLGPKGEIFVATRNGFRIKVQKLSNQLEVVKSLDINAFDIEGSMNNHQPSKRIMYMIGDLFCLISETFGVEDEKRFVQRQIRFYNQNLDPVGEWVKLSKNVDLADKLVQQNYGIKLIVEASESEGQKAYKKLRDLGHIHFNETGLISVTMDLNREWSVKDPMKYYMTRFDSTGLKVYSKEVIFLQASESFFLVDLVLMEDGSMLYFFQQDGIPAYRIITNDGEEIEGEEFGFDENEFTLRKVVRDPVNTDCFVLAGFNEANQLAVYYYSLIGFKSGQSLVQVSFSEIQNLNPDHWVIDIYENMLYIVGFSGSGDYLQNLFQDTETVLGAARIDLSKSTLPAEELTALPNTVFSPQFILRESRLNVNSTISGIKALKDGVLLDIKTYIVHSTAQGQYYVTTSPSGILFDFKNEIIKFKDNYTVAVPDIEMKEDKAYYYLFSKETEKPNKKMLAFRELDYSTLPDTDSAKTLYHIPERINKTTAWKKLGIYADEDGKEFIYMKVSTSHLYLRLPLPATTAN